MRITAPLPVRRAWAAVEYRGRRRRRWWVGDRLHVEVRGLAPPGTVADELGAAVERAVAAVPGVAWVAANPVLGRVIVACGPGRLRDVIEAIEAAEAACGVSRAHMPSGLPGHPADREPANQALIALVADMLGIGTGLVGTALARSPLPTEIAALTGLLDAEPHLRALVSDVFGPVVTDLALAASNATAQALAQGPLGIVTDGIWRALALAETTARRRSWAEQEPDLCHTAALAGAPAIDAPARPLPLPGGAVERYADGALLAGLAAGVSAAVTTGQPGRAAAGLYAGLPKAARFGREVFAVHLTRWLSGRGGVVLDRAALRRLDRVDTVVLDGAAFRGEPPAWVVSVVASARRAGFMVVLAGDQATGRALDADLVVPGRRELAAEVRQLQADGCVVLLFSDGRPAAADALWGADVGVGMRGPRARRVPWSADVLLAPTDAWWLVDACATAAQVARQSVALTMIGAAAASTVVFAAPRSNRYSWPVNGAAILSMANATRAAVSLGRRSRPEAAEPVPPWHSLDGTAVLELVRSDLEGLTTEVARARIPPARRSSPAAVRLVAAVGEELANPLTPVLAGGAALSAALGGAVDAGIVAAVTTANALIGGIQRYRSEQASESLGQVGEVLVHVRRDGRLVELDQRRVVVGDVVVLRAGDVVPADARILEADGVLADESTLTGESMPVPKTAEPSTADAVVDRRSMLYGETNIAAGEAVAVVVATGRDTEAGSASVGERWRAGGVEARLRDLTRRAIPISVGAGAAVVGAGLLRGRPLQQTLASGVSLAVAAVPEGLPLVATMAQLASARRLGRKGAVVRNHRAIEALGRVDVLCTDKTGTLTIGRLAVRLVSDLSAEAGLSALGASQRRVLSAALRATPAADEHRRLAHPTDAAIVSAASAAGVDDDDDQPGWRRVVELPFEPAQGFHATVGRAGRRRLVSVKGAPELVIPRCSRIAGSGRLSPAVLANVEAHVERLARRGLRVLAVAEGTHRGPVSGDVDEADVSGLVLLGLVAIADPVRPEAASAVAGLQAAGVRVCMVTGDHPSTAEGIAVELGILEGRRVLAGAELVSLSDEALDRVIEEVSVFARVTPADKVRIVQSLQRVGRVVAMTGDGSNDAPAIRLADVGVAMGSHSTPAARQAADVIVTNDDIETLIDAIVEGRALWGSVRDALAILLGGNLGEIGFIVAGAALTGSSPLNTRQLLLVNLLTDVAPSLAIAVRPPARRAAEELLGEGPERSLGRPLDRAILGRAVLTTLGPTVAWLPARLTGGPRRASTVALVSLVGSQLAQTVTSGGTHPTVLAAGLGSALVLVGIVQTPGLSQLFGCVPLDPLAWAQAGGGVATATALAVGLPAAATLWQSAAARARAVGPSVRPGEPSAEEPDPFPVAAGADEEEERSA
jgi:cation-transporting ATPase I